LGLFFSTSVMAKHSLKRNPIYHAITVLNKKINKEKAFKYSNIISKLSRKYKLDPFLVVSIARQESRINLATVRTMANDEIIETDKGYIKIVHITDFCMMQIHKSNVKNLKLSPNRLLEDPQYCIETGVDILRGFKYLAKEDEFWWTRYNASDRKPEKREEYKNHVLAHYKKLEEKIPNMKKIVKRYTQEMEIAYDGNTKHFP
jgi:hypothetical protein